MEALWRPPIAFAHRGARAHAPENTLEGFSLARSMGATGLESDVWLTADGIPVLDHDGIVKHGLRRRPISGFQRADLPPHIPALADLYAECGTAFQLSLDVKDPAAFKATVDVARAAGDGAPERLWLCHPDWELLATWRETGDDIKLVDSTRRKRIKEGPERRAASLAEAGIDAINLHQTDWTGGLTTLFHRFERYCFGWDAQFERVMIALLGMGIDGIHSDHVDRLVAVITEFER